MKRCISGRIAAVVFGSLVVLSVATVAGARDECSNATLQGSYGGSFSGEVRRPGDAGSTPVAGIGRFNYDGRGSFEAKETLSFGGSSFSFEFRGTYSVDADCTGTHTLFTLSGEEFGHLAIVIVEDGQEVRVTQTDPGVTLVGNERKQSSKAATRHDREEEDDDDN